MRIAVNCRLLLHNKMDGIGVFKHETLQRITRAHPNVEFLFLFDRPYHASFIYADNIRPIVLPPQARHPLLYYAWFEGSVAWALKKYKADLFFSGDGFLSLQTKVPQIPVIHDLNFHYFPHYFSWFDRNYYLHFFPKFAQKATRIATVSEYSKNDIMRWYQQPATKIDVVYNGANEVLYRPVSDQIQHEQWMHWGGGTPYFLFIGSLYPRKNILNQLKAFEIFKKKTQASTKFVLVGSVTKYSKSLLDWIAQSAYASDIQITGRMNPPEKVRDMLGSALALMYVSEFEGFGLPIVEAMRCGVPVITGNTTAMPEVGGEAALYAPFDDPEAIAAHMIEIYKNSTLRSTLTAKGIIQSHQFTWDRTADLIWQSIQTSLKS